MSTQSSGCRSRLLRAALVITIVIATSAAAAPAALAAPRDARTGEEPNTSGAASIEDRTIVATGTARVRGTPDVLSMVLGVTSRGRTVGEALDRNNDAARKVTEALLEGGIDEGDIQTTDFSIGPVHDDRDGTISGYAVSNLVVAELHDLGRAGALIDRAAEAGGDDVVVQQVSFAIDDTSDLVATARADAVKRARAQAEQLAGAAGVELGRVVRISESSTDPGPVASASEAASDRGAAVPIHPGSELLTVQVTVVFSIT